MKKNNNVKRDANGNIIIPETDLCYSQEQEEEIESILTFSYEEPTGKILKSFEM